jgi:hypothetical protein
MSSLQSKVNTTFVVYGREFPAYSVGCLFLFVTIVWGFFGTFLLSLISYGVYKAGDGKTIKTTVPIEIVDARDEEDGLVRDGNMD